MKHIAKFTSGIWQIHPFGEGNTRATAVFVIKYLRTFSFLVSNDVFRDNSWYFRNALVRANYNNLKNNIHATTRYLEYFFENLILDSKHKLQNRYLHIEYSEQDIQSATYDSPKCQVGTLNCTLEELAILKTIATDCNVTQKQLAIITGQSDRSVKRRTASLQEKGLLRRINGKRNGKWEILIDLN